MPPSEEEAESWRACSRGRDALSSRARDAAWMEPAGNESDGCNEGGLGDGRGGRGLEGAWPKRGRSLMHSLQTTLSLTETSGSRAASASSSRTRYTVAENTVSPPQSTFLKIYYLHYLLSAAIRRRDHRSGTTATTDRVMWKRYRNRTAVCD